MGDWNPSLYLKFEKERTQPVKDLIHGILLDKVNTVIDIGCGPGNSTEELRKKWSEAKIIGMDYSANMIEEAKKRMPNIQWIIEDGNQDLSYLGKFDLVFSNAAIQWMDDHERLLAKFFTLVNNRGALAIQIPEVSQMPIQIAVEKVAKSGKWTDRWKDKEPMRYNVAGYYYDILCSLSEEVYLWETQYYHVMENHQSIIEWYRSTGMKPYLDLLEGEEKNVFEQMVFENIQKEYKIQKDGRVLFPFKRIFFVAYRADSN